MGSSLTRSKTIKVEPAVQIQYLKDTITRQKKELKESFNKVSFLENALAISRQEFGQCKMDLELSKQEIIYNTKEISSLEKEIYLLKNPSLRKILSRSMFTIVLGILDLFAVLIYSYAINKITGNPPDKTAEILIPFAASIYIAGLVLQLFHRGANNS